MSRPVDPWTALEERAMADVREWARGLQVALDLLAAVQERNPRAALERVDRAEKGRQIVPTPGDGRNCHLRVVH